MNDFSISDETIVTSTQTARTMRRADVLFLLDCTGTMENTLTTNKTTIAEVVEIYENSDIKIRLGLTEYRDLTQSQDAHLNRMHLHTFEDDSHFTTNIDEFQNILFSLVATGGGPNTESTYDALGHSAIKADWDEGADKIMVLFSDGMPYRKGRIVEDVCNLCSIIKQKKIDQLHFVINRRDKKIISRFTTLLHCIPDVRNPQLTIFGNTYSIFGPTEDTSSTQHLDHLKDVLLNIAKTSGSQAGGKISGPNPYGPADAIRSEHITGCALDRRDKTPPTPKPKPVRSKNSPILSREDKNQGRPKPIKEKSGLNRNNKNPYS
jgi:hypothetical protein